MGTQFFCVVDFSKFARQGLVVPENFYRSVTIFVPIANLLNVAGTVFAYSIWYWEDTMFLTLKVTAVVAAFAAVAFAAGSYMAHAGIL